MVSRKRRRRSPLEYGQRPVLQLQDYEVAGGREDRADVAVGPAAVARLATGEVVEGDVAVLAPGEPVIGLGLREEAGIAVIAEDVDGLGEVEVGVFPVAKTVLAGLIDADSGLAVADPLLGEVGIVLAGVEGAGDSSGG